MKEYRIIFDLNTEYLDGQEFEIAEKLNQDGFVVKTFEEYHNLLYLISGITDGQFHIYNYGTMISSY